MRELLDAIFYVLRGGIAWNLLPKDLPPKHFVRGSPHGMTPSFRGHSAAVEIGCDLPPSDGWKGERQDRIVGHGGRGRRDKARMIGLDIQILRTIKP